MRCISRQDIVTLSDDAVKVADEVLQVLKPLKTVTTLLSTATAPSVSMILPLKTRILQSMAPSEEDSTIPRDVKAAIRGDLNPRYTDPYLQDYLHRSTALDPRFKSLSHLDLSAGSSHRADTRHLPHKRSRPWGSFSGRPLRARTQARRRSPTPSKRRWHPTR